MTDDLNGLQVLLVEDDEINQEVATAQLESAGLLVSIANNGQEAVARLSEQPCDLVLMDLQMPVMDGYQATRLIRQDSRFASLPIIALSANILAEGKAKALEAGMNDCLAKPIVADELQAALRRISGRSRPSKALRRTAAVVSQDSERIDFPGMTGFDVTAALERMVNNRSRYRTMLFRFRGRFADAGTRVREMLTQGNRAGALQLAHTLAGVAGNLSAVEVHAVALALNKVLKKEAEEVPESLLSGLEQSLKQSLIAIERLEIACQATEEPSSQEVEEPSEEASQQTLPELSCLLGELKRLLEEDDAQAGLQLEKLRQPLLERGLVAELNELEKRVGRYDFDSALDCLLQIAQRAAIPLAEESAQATPR